MSNGVKTIISRFDLYHLVSRDLAFMSLFKCLNFMGCELYPAHTNRFDTSTPANCIHHFRAMVISVFSPAITKNPFLL